jgi:hypothetical protein
MGSDDAQALAGRYAEYASDLVRYQADHGGDDDVDQMQLAMLVSSVTQHSRVLANDAMATVFDDDAAAVKTLQSVTSDAKRELCALDAQRGTFEKVAKITTGVINIGVGLATRNPSATLKAAQTLAAAIAA